MPVDVQVEVVINKSRGEVAAYAMDPKNDPIWISGIVEAKALTEPPMSLGTQVARLAKFLGKRIEYVLEVVEYEPNSLLAMKSVKGPFPMEVSYWFQESPGGTLAEIHVQGEASGFYSKINGPVMSLAVKRNVTKDLKRLKKLLESEGPA